MRNQSHQKQTITIKKMTAIHILKFIIRLMLFIIFLPLTLLVMSLKYLHFKAILIHNLEFSGMPRKLAKELAKETKMGKMISFNS